MSNKDIGIEIEIGTQDPTAVECIKDDLTELAGWNEPVSEHPRINVRDVACTVLVYKVGVPHGDVD